MMVCWVVLYFDGVGMIDVVGVQIFYDCVGECVWVYLV